MGRGHESRQTAQLVSTLETDASASWQRLRRVWPELDWEAAVFSHGAFHHVAVLGDSAVVRVSFASEHVTQTRAEFENLRTVVRMGLPFPVPSPLHEPYSEAEWSAQSTTFIAGEPQLERPWPQVREPIANVLTALREASVVGVDAMRPVRDWCGAEQWPEIVGSITSSLDHELAKTAQRVVRDVLEVEASAAKPGLVHGDLGPHNLLWTSNRLPGVIDFDNACIGDPAIDLAPLIGHFGADAVAEIADPEILARGQVHRASLSLQVAAAAELSRDEQLRDFALRNFSERLEAGTLYDPDARRIA